MIDSCDSSVACWSEDGETFIVKSTDHFEKKVIPEFFKHSKFSSFVRQLNFYGFRKIKYADTIKIDAKLEAETANFWRFRHDKFQRGKPEWLSEIKRSVGAQNILNPTDIKPKPMLQKVEDTTGLKSEVTVLKKRIEAMTKNIDELTSLVQKVTLKQDDQVRSDVDMVDVGSKRKKLDIIRPDSLVSSMELEDFSVMRDHLFPPLPLQQVRRETSETSAVSDEDFVDHLFTAFGDDSLDGLLDDVPSGAPCQQITSIPSEQENNPDPELMKKLSDALKLLPTEMQEMIVDRLVASIISTDSLQKNVTAASALSNASRETRSLHADKIMPVQVPPSPVLEGRPSPDQHQPQQVSMSLAAATLAALLTHYSTTHAVKEKAVSHDKALPPAITIHA
jgi:HSF-type DNA-binding